MMAHAGKSLTRAPQWFMDVKVWLGVFAVVFTLGGTYSVWSSTNDTHLSVVKGSYELLMEHQKITESAVLSGHQTQNLLQEIVRISRVNCINNAKDAPSRNACL